MRKGYRRAVLAGIPYRDMEVFCIHGQLFFYFSIHVPTECWHVQLLYWVLWKSHSLFITRIHMYTIYKTDPLPSTVLQL